MRGLAVFALGFAAAFFLGAAVVAFLVVLFAAGFSVFFSVFFLVVVVVAAFLGAAALAGAAFYLPEVSTRFCGIIHFRKIKRIIALTLGAGFAASFSFLASFRGPEGPRGKTTRQSIHQQQPQQSVLTRDSMKVPFQDAQKTKSQK